MSHWVWRNEEFSNVGGLVWWNFTVLQHVSIGAAIKIENRENLGQCPNRGGGGKKNKKSQFQFGNFENQRGGSQFCKNDWFKNGSQTSKINSSCWYFLVKICIFSCLPSEIYFNFFPFRMKLAFSDANMIELLRWLN